MTIWLRLMGQIAVAVIRRLAHGRAALLVLLVAAPGCAASKAGPKLDRSRLELAFSEDFKQPPRFYDLVKAPDGRWKTNFWFSIQGTADPGGWEARTLRPNKELQYYGDPLHGMNPFRWRAGALDIVADRNPYRADPITNNLPYLSGLLTTERSFSQRYGYFEARITMPVGKGLWPAFWLLPTPDVKGGWAQPKGQQEIDIFENIGQPDELWLTLHHDVGGKKVGDGEKITGIAVGRPHTYGLLLTKSEIIWYVDDREVRRRANTDFHEPAYMLINLAVGGAWPGNPDASTTFPARMSVNWVRAYRLKR